MAIHRGRVSSFSQMLLLNDMWNLNSERREQILRLNELIKEVLSPLPWWLEVEDWRLSLWDGFWEGCRAGLAGPFKMYLLLLVSNQSLKLQKTSNIIWSNSLPWRTQVLLTLHYRWGNWGWEVTYPKLYHQLRHENSLPLSSEGYPNSPLYIFS